LSPTGVNPETEILDPTSNNMHGCVGNDKVTVSPFPAADVTAIADVKDRVTAEPVPATEVTVAFVGSVASIGIL
jgi:hypothetical protein